VGAQAGREAAPGEVPGVTQDRQDDAFDEDPFVEDGLDPVDDDLEDIGESTDSETILRRAIGVVDTARAMPLSTSVLVSREEMSALLHAALERLPDDMRQARWLLKEREEFIESGKREADNLLEEVRAQAERMVQRTEIVRQANQVAQRVVQEAREEARRLKHEAEDFCDQRLASFEIVLERTLKTVAAGREKLQATPPPEGGSPWHTASTRPSGASGSGNSARAGEEWQDAQGTVFDQDEH
jgi:F0F1-type ATP synthase membrane subunit b/b'